MGQAEAEKHCVACPRSQSACKVKSGLESGSLALKTCILIDCFTKPSIKTEQINCRSSTVGAAD